MNLENSRLILTNCKIKKFMKSSAMETELLHADRQKDRHDEINSRFSQFYENT
jgi:hypothetical protein